VAFFSCDNDPANVVNHLPNAFTRNTLTASDLIQCLPLQPRQQNSISAGGRLRVLHALGERISDGKQEPPGTDGIDGTLQITIGTSRFLCGPVRPGG
jgi:hypothetical protein